MCVNICFYTRIFILLVVFNMLKAIVFLFGYKTEIKMVCALNSAVFVFSKSSNATGFQVQALR